MFALPRKLTPLNCQRRLKGKVINVFNPYDIEGRLSKAPRILVFSLGWRLASIFTLRASYFQGKDRRIVHGIHFSYDSKLQNANPLPGMELEADQL
jgi:hypothetical protein